MDIDLVAMSERTYQRDWLDMYDIHSQEMTSQKDTPPLYIRNTMYTEVYRTPRRILPGFKMIILRIGCPECGSRPYQYHALEVEG